MNKEAPKLLSFSFPIMDEATPRKHLVDLFVTGSVEIGRENQILRLNIYKINHAAKGERFASDIKTILQCINKPLYQEICEAALTFAADTYDLKRSVLI